MNKAQTNYGKGAWVGALTLILGLALTGWVLSSLKQLHDRLATISPALAVGVMVVLTLVLLAVLVQGLRLLWRSSRARKDRTVAVDVSSDPAQAAEQSIDAARQQIQLITEEVARCALQAELDSVSQRFAARQYTIAVFGTGSAGKTSIINALRGRAEGITEPTVGTTKTGQEHAYVIDGMEHGALRLIDTPGLSEIGQGGNMREQRARELASDADLVLFVVDQDLRDIESAPLRSLGRLGKRALIVLNKRDLYTDDEWDRIAARIRERIGTDLPESDLVVCAADPREVTVEHADGTRSIEKPLADVAPLADRIAQIMRDDGLDLLARNTLLRAHRISHRATDAIDEARRAKARTIVRRFQWTTAGVMFVNPVPGLGALATAAINYQMITEIAKVFAVSLSVSEAKKLARELAEVLLKMGVVGLTTQILGKSLKASVAGFVAGGAIEAVAGAYLTRLSGLTFVDYFSHGQSWGDGGMQQAVEQRFELRQKSDFVRDFITEASRRILGASEGKHPDE